MIQSILCEGLYDIWFFDQISKEKGLNPHRIHRDLSKFQELIGRCTRFLMERGDNPLIILGDDGRVGVFGKYLNRSVKEYIGKVSDHVTLFVIVDDDHKPIEDHIQKVESTLNTLKTASNYMKTLEIEREGNKIIIIHPKHRYNVTIEVHTMPDSLERLTADYYYALNNFKGREKGSVHDEIHSIAQKYYNGKKEEMFRNYASVCYSESDEWLTAIIEGIKV